MTFHLKFDLTNTLHTSDLTLKVIEMIWPESPDLNGWQGEKEGKLEIQKFEYFENEKSFLD